ncbi:MAG: hypothetical protein M0R74_03470 [Dehalococcoidia bacterium]|nr:hypothetical protein [Dehalococcoidia bacterium]
MDEETRKRLGDVVEALEAILVATQLEANPEGRKESDYAVREAVKRVNRLRRTLQGGGDAA